MTTDIKIPNPLSTTWKEWASTAIEQVKGNISLINEENWRNFAISLMNQAPFNQQSILDPYTFSRWQDWAETLAKSTLSGT